MLAQSHQVDLSESRDEPRTTLLVPVDYTLGAERLVDAALQLAASNALSIVLVGLLPSSRARDVIDVDDVRTALTAAELGFGPWQFGVEPLPGVEEQALIAAVRRLRARAARTGHNTGLRFLHGDLLDQQLRALAASLDNEVVVLLPSTAASWGTLHELSASLADDPALDVLIVPGKARQMLAMTQFRRVLAAVRTVQRALMRRTASRV